MIRKLKLTSSGWGCHSYRLVRSPDLPLAVRTGPYEFNITDLLPGHRWIILLNGRYRQNGPKAALPDPDDRFTFANIGVAILRLSVRHGTILLPNNPCLHQGVVFRSGFAKCGFRCSYSTL
jgi:hypothetical protein